MKKMTKFRRSVKAISPIISVLLMIAIAVSAALVAYAWVSGYMDFTTTKVGKSIQIQSISTTAVYVQNVGESDVTLESMYVDGTLVAANFAPAGLQPSNTSIVTPTSMSWADASRVTIKIVTTDGISAEMTKTFSSISGSQTEPTHSVNFVLGTGDGSVSPGDGSYSGNIAILATAATGYEFVQWESSTASITFGDSNLASTSATINGAGTITANFVEISPVTLLNENFDDYLHWSDNWSGNWERYTNSYHSSPASVRADEYHDEDFTSVSLDASSATSLLVDFYYMLDDTENDDFVLYFYDGANWDQIQQLGDGNEDQWLHFSQTFTDTQYFNANFRIRFDADSMSGSGGGGAEHVYVDDVLIIANPTP